MIDPRAELISLLPRLRRFAYGLTGDGHQADDLVQTGCLKAIERWQQYQPGTSLASWLFRILQTTWLDEYRTRQRQQTDSWDEGFDELKGDDGTTLLEARSEARAKRLITVPSGSSSTSAASLYDRPSTATSISTAR